MKLYYSPGACSLVPHIVLKETGLSASLVKVDLQKHRTENNQDYYQQNPKGQVPLLQLDDGTTLSEGPVIAQYLADLARHETLMPKAGTIARYKVMEWQNYITSELHKSYGPLFSNTFDANARKLIVDQLLKKLKWVDQQLANSSFLTGDNFTAADAYLFVVLNWSGHLKIDISGFANLQRFMKKVAERPTVQQALREEGLLAQAA